MQIKIDPLTGPEIYELLTEHLQSMASHSPEESCHALDIGALRQPEITFWTAWQDNDLLGCGAIKELSPEQAEIKSMRTSSKHLRQGVAKALLGHIMAEALSRNYQRVSLETGTVAAFDPARKMYESFGFSYCEPFADYTIDPFSTFMTKVL
ncbi:MAG: GNAT family N-acetyltransferase [Proteobacteria bacterium]|nr:GNAT family N-acetyltransferase [Pseudomonadota bacterium]